MGGPAAFPVGKVNALFKLETRIQGIRSRMPDMFLLAKQVAKRVVLLRGKTFWGLDAGSLNWYSLLAGSWLRWKLNSDEVAVVVARGDSGPRHTDEEGPAHDAATHLVIRFSLEARTLLGTLYARTLV